MVRIPSIGIEQKQPSFFKITLPGRSNEHVRIPPRFVREHIVNGLTKQAKLRLKRSSEYSWNIKVKRSREDVYLKDGWLEFRRAARLDDKEFLVFICTGKMHFSIKVFDKNGCERMDFPDFSRHQNTTSCKSTKRPRGRPRKSIPADMLKEVKQEEEDYINNTEKFTSKSTEMLTESCKRSTVRQKETTSEKIKRSCGKPRKYPATGKHISKSELDVLEEVKEEEYDNHESGELLKPKLQYFTSKIQRLTQVYVGKPFYEENLSSRNYDNVMLKNSEGTEWFKVTLSSYRDTAFMTKGWHAFADANQVKVGSLPISDSKREQNCCSHIEQLNLSSNCKISFSQLVIFTIL